MKQTGLSIASKETELLHKTLESITEFYTKADSQSSNNNRSDITQRDLLHLLLLRAEVHLLLSQVQEALVSHVAIAVLFFWYYSIQLKLFFQSFFLHFLLLYIYLFRLSFSVFFLLIHLCLLLINRMTVRKLQKRCKCTGTKQAACRAASCLYQNCVHILHNRHSRMVSLVLPQRLKTITLTLITLKRRMRMRLW